MSLGQWLCVRQRADGKLPCHARFYIPHSVGGDYRNALPSITLTSTQQLLARLEVEHISSSPLDAVGNTFTIGLIDNGATEFWSDDLGTLSTIDPASSQLSNFGTVTITSAAVPEPGTFAVLAIAGVGFLGRKWQRRTKTGLQIAESPTDS